MPYFVHNNHSPSQAPWRQSPMFIVAWSVIGGTVLGWGMRVVIDSWLWGIVGSALALTAVVLYRLKNGKLFVSTLFAILSIAAVSAAWMVHCTKQIGVDWPEERTGWLVEVGQTNKVEEGRLTIDARIVAGGSPIYSDKKVRIFFHIPSQSPTPTLQAGDLIRVQTRFRLNEAFSNPGTFDYSEYLLAHGISGTAYVAMGKWQKMPDSVRQHFAQSHIFSSLKSRLLRVRNHLVAIYRNYIPQQTDLAIMTALTLGDKSLLRDEARQVFSATGTSHVLALSGLHLSILFAVLNALLVIPLRRRSTLRIAMSALVVIVLWMFVCLAGAPLSLLRAASMLSLMQVGIGLRRHRNATLNHLCTAACLLLIADPLSVLDAGFQLSFSAVLAIILVQDFVWSRMRLPIWETPLWVSTFHWKKEKDSTWLDHWQTNVRPLLTYHTRKHAYLFLRNRLLPFITVGLSAQWGTMPFTLYYFHVFTPYTWIANFVAIPAVSLLLSASIVFFVIPIDIVRAGIAQFLQTVLHTMQTLLGDISHWWGAEVPIYVSGFTASMVVVLPTLLIIYMRLRRHRQRTIVAALFATLLLTAASIEVWQWRGLGVRPQICVYKVTRTTVLHLVESTHASALYSNVDAAQTSQRLQYLYRDYFYPKHFHNIQIHSLPSAQDHHATNASQTFTFHQKRIIVIDLRKPFMATHAPSTAQRTDILILSDANGTPFSPLLRAYAPRQVILSSALPYRLRQRYALECQRAHTPCHDVGEAGAFVREL